MGIRFNNNAYLKGAQSFINSWDTHFVSLGKSYRVYKFRKLSGIIRMTPTGEKSLNFDPSKFTQVFNLYTSKEPVNLLWENSTKLEVVEEDDSLRKVYSVGDYYDLYGNSSFTVENGVENISLISNEFAIQQLKKEVNLYSKDWVPSDSDILDFVYLILDHRAQSYQWLEITSISPNYNEETEELQNVSIEFSNIGTKFAESGRNILDFFQFGAIGEGYAFPLEKIVDDGEGNKQLITEVDNNYKIDVGCQTFQYDFMCNAADSSYQVWGRPIGELNADGSYSVPKPQRLFLYQEHFPLSSEILFNQPNSNSFYYEGVVPSVSAVWESYKENPGTNNNIGQYNILNTKEVLTGFSMDGTTVRTSNAIEGGTYKYFNWNNTPIVQLKKPYNFDSVIGVKSISTWPTSPKLFSYCDFLNFNTFVNFDSWVFNYDNEETKKFKLTDTLGIIGGVMNILIGGLNIGWTTTIANAPKQYMNLRFPCIAYNNGMSALSKVAPLPADLFLDDKSKSVLPVATNVMTSHRFSLTDRIQDTSQVIAGNPAGKGGNGIWNLKYLGQTHFEDGTQIFSDGSSFEINWPTTTSIAPAYKYQKFIIDAIVPHIITNADVRFSAYVKDTLSGEQIGVYQTLFSTLSKSVNDLRLWGSVLKFNAYEDFNTTGKVKWPELITAPAPPGTKNPIRFDTTDISTTFTFENLGTFIRKTTYTNLQQSPIFNLEFQIGYVSEVLHLRQVILSKANNYTFKPLSFNANTALIPWLTKLSDLQYFIWKGTFSSSYGAIYPLLFYVEIPQDLSSNTFTFRLNAEENFFGDNAPGRAEMKWSYKYINPATGVFETRYRSSYANTSFEFLRNWSENIKSLNCTLVYDPALSQITFSVEQKSIPGGNSTTLTFQEPIFPGGATEITNLGFQELDYDGGANWNLNWKDIYILPR